MAAWLLTNINRDSTKRSEPFSLEEVTAWLGYAGHYVKVPPAPAPEPPTVEDLKNRMGIVHMLHKGLYGENGAQGSQGEGS
jgi:hypothetical protein